MTKKHSLLERLRAFPTVDGTPVLETFDLIEEAGDEIERLQHYADTCGGSDNDGRCPMRHLLHSQGEPAPDVTDE